MDKKKNRLKELLKKLNSLEKSLPISETQTYLSTLVDTETKNFKKNLENNPTVQFLDQLNTKLDKFKRDFDLAPVIKEIEAIQQDISTTKETNQSEMGKMGETHTQKMAELSTLVKGVKDDLSSMTGKQIKDLLGKISVLESGLNFQDNNSKEQGKSLKQVMGDFEAKLKDISESIESDKLFKTDLLTNTESRFSKNEGVSQETIKKVEDLKKDILTRLANIGGGGNMNRQININSSVMSTKYTDVNFLGSITKADNNTTKQVDITFAGGSSGLEVGVTQITGGTTTRILYDNAGVLGEYTLTGTGTVVAMATAPTFATSITGSYLTASEILITDGSKNIVSAPVATYPSLTELTYLKGVTSAIQTQITARELLSNKATSFGTLNDTLYPTTQAVATYVAAQIVGLLDYRGSYDASSNLFPATGGSGIAGAILKGDFWICSVPGTLGGVAVTAGDLIIALTDIPGQTAGNWDLISNELGYTPANDTLSNLATTAINTSLVSDTDSTDSIGSTGVRWLKGWFDDMETTNMPTVGGTSLSTTFAAKAGALTQFTANNNWKVVYTDGSGDVQELALGASGTVLTSGGASSAPSFATPSGAGSALALVPQPILPITTGVTAAAFANNTLGRTWAIQIPYSITVTALTLNVTTKTTNGTLKIGLYSEDGQTQKFAIETATISATGVVTTVVSSTALTAGIYYFVVVCTGTTDIEIDRWAVTDGTNNWMTSISGKQILAGNLTLTAGTLPATFNPQADISATSGVCQAFRLN